jgi:tetratricopeptide (TPR) repeat protein
VEAEPTDPLNHYNLACLLSRIDKLKEANNIFRHIVQNMDHDLAECYFYMAVNHGLMEELPEAKRCLQKYLHADPDGDMAEEAEDLLMALEDDEDYEIFNSELSATETEELLKLASDMGSVKFGGRLLEDESFAKALNWGLYQGADILKEAILRLYGQTACELSRQNLAEFAANPWVNERLKQVALQELRRIDPQGECRIYKEGRFRRTLLRDCPPPAPIWETKWQQVIERTFANMRRGAFYSEEFYNDAEAIWLDYINQVYPDGPRIDKPETWAAGLEYCLARFHFLGLTQKELAAAYGVSVGSVQRKFAEINRVLQIDRKAYRNMLVFLSDRDSEQY